MIIRRRSRVFKSITVIPILLLLPRIASIFGLSYLMSIMSLKFRMKLLIKCKDTKEYYAVWTMNVKTV